MIRMLSELVPPSVLALLVSEAIFVFSSFVLACLVVLDIDPWVFLRHDRGMLRIAFVELSILLGLYFHDLYAQIRIRSRILLLQQVCQSIGIAFLVQALVSYLRPAWVVPRWVMVVGSGFALPAIIGWRILYTKVVLRALGGMRVLFLGRNELVEAISQRVKERPELGIEIIGTLEEEGRDAPAQTAEPVLGGVGVVKGIVERTRPDRIVVGMREKRRALPVSDLLDLRLSGVLIDDAAKMYENIFGRVSVSNLLPGQLIFSSDLGPRPGRVAIQTLYSSAIGLIGVVLTAPLMLAITLAIKVSSRGPILYRQKRVGLNGETFVLYKFRSMYDDAEARTGAVWASKDDPRVTPLGRWLRRLRLDELPQLLNVLRGEMSIVGPRPERPEFVKTLVERIPYYRQRHCVKPGITGWAQINHKYSDTLEDTVEKLEYDLYYIKNLSPALDAYIIFHTLKTMLLSRGAH